MARYWGFQKIHRYCELVSKSLDQIGGKLWQYYWTPRWFQALQNIRDIFRGGWKEWERNRIISVICHNLIELKMTEIILMCIWEMNKYDVIKKTTNNSNCVLNKTFSLFNITASWCLWNYFTTSKCDVETKTTAVNPNYFKLYDQIQMWILLYYVFSDNS